MKRSHYIIGGLALAMSMPSCLQAQTTQPKDTTMTPHGRCGTRI